MNQEKSLKSSWGEKISYGLADVGANLCWTFMLIYVTMYYTDSVGISAATVGTVMLVARLLDGVSDVAGAYIMERTHMRFGKFKPWLVICAPLLGIGMWACFHVPGSLSDQGKAIYVFVTYTFVAAVAYTLYNLAYSSILPLMTVDESDRNKAAVAARIITNLGVMVMTTFTPTLLIKWGGYNSQGSWGKLATLYAVLCAFLIGMFGFIAKERALPQEPAKEDGEKVPTGKLLLQVLSVKYTWILLIIYICFFLCSGVAGIRSYYFKDVLGDFELFGIASPWLTVATVVMMFVLPSVMQKIGKVKTVVIGLVVYIVGNLMLYVVGSSTVGIIISFILQGAGNAPIAVAVFVFIADLSDYVARTKNIRVEGFVSMAASVGTKIGSGLGSAVVGWGLAWFGYDGTAEVQSAAALSGITGITALFPAIMAVIIIVCLRMWNMDKAEKN